MSKIAIRSIALSLALIAGASASAPSYAATADRGSNGPASSTSTGINGPDQSALILYGQPGNCDLRVACDQPRQPKTIARRTVSKDGCKVILVRAGDGTLFRVCRDEIVN